MRRLAVALLALVLPLVSQAEEGPRPYPRVRGVVFPPVRNDQPLRCARGQYSDQCGYVDFSARPLRDVPGARPLFQVSGCARRVVVYGQTFCDDRERDFEAPQAVQAALQPQADPAKGAQK